MAELLFTFAVEQILERVTSLAIQQIAGAWGVKKDLQTLTELTRRIDGKVKEAQNYEAPNSQSAKTLLVKLQDVLYSAEDVLDDFSYEILRRKIEVPPRPMVRIRGFASRNNPILFRLKMARKVKKINESLADIEKQALRDFALTGKAVTDPVVVSDDQPDRVTVSFLDKSEPPAVGRESEVKAIVNMLQVSSSTPSLLTVVSIVGFGGLGKTTLAKMVFHQVKETTNLFDEALWVCVSEPFDVKTILKGMLETLNENAGGLESVEAIVRHLESKLKDKRFLLVLDDVWEDSGIKCNTLKTHLMTICSRAGSFVIVTTRKLNVTKAMDTQDEHVVALKGLEDKECWDIIRSKCVMQWRKAVPKELEEIGVEVGRKCKGVPLAAKVVGGTLCKKKTKEEWLSIQNSNAWDQIDEDNQMFPILKLSFHQLHPSLKQCFVYCSVFPKDFEYRKEKLIELWMAEGFLNTTSTTNRGSGEKPMEAVGEECFNGLIVHSFFQDVQVDGFGNISCKMHDLLHDVATSVSNYKMLKWNDKSILFVRTSNYRHHPTAKELEQGGERMVRGVISDVVGDVCHMFSTFKSLRSLDISYANLEELPSIIERLKHLRYLDMSYNHLMTELPEFITKFYNLQTLRLNSCWRIRELPTNMANLVRLRYIHFDNRNLNIYNVGRLHELRTLRMFEVREEEGFGIEELNKLNELRGKLQISRLHLIKDKEEAERANLKEKKNLTQLSLEWDSIDNDVDVLEGLMPPPSIKSLTMRKYGGMKNPNWMCTGINNCLPQLEQLSLFDCKNCELMPSLGHLPLLKTVYVQRSENIRIIGSEFYGECKGDVTLFPVLKKLSLIEMKSLEECVAAEAVEDGEETIVEVFPLLEVLLIEGCPRLRSIPLRHLSSLVRLNIEGCEDMEYISNDIQNFPSLANLEIKDCRKLVSLSNLQELKSLKILRIEGCVGLTSLSKGLVSLETLVIETCGDLSADAFCGLSSLKSLSLFSGCMESFPNLERPSRLEELTICACPELTSVPKWLKSCTSLRQLDISSCEKLISIENDFISSLTQLKVLELGPFSGELENFPGLNSIHLFSSSLEKLCINGWPKLKSLTHQLQHLTALRDLSLYSLKGVSSINDDIFSSLTQLKELTLGPFSDKLVEFPGLNSIHLLSQIETLYLYGWPELKSLPQHLQHLTFLKELYILNFQGLEALPDWLGNLSSLQDLQIRDCENLKNLPTTIKNLSNLTGLYASGCPLLEERYNQFSGPDAHHVSHIARVYFES